MAHSARIYSISISFSGQRSGRSFLFRIRFQLLESLMGVLTMESWEAISSVAHKLDMKVLFCLIYCRLAI